MSKLVVLKDGFKKMIDDIFSFNIDRIKRQSANILTILRGILAPILIIISLLLDSFSLSIIIIIFFSLTDLLDGYIARKYNYVSEFGASIDTICDKIFIFVLILPIFSVIKYFSIIIVILELLIAIHNSIYFIKGKGISSTKLGKVKTFVLDIFVIFCYLYKVFNINIIYLNIFGIICMCLQLLTLFNYIYLGIKSLK